ncbi:MAG: ZIP family metal transporter [Clostridia bacterium]|nr:ZIP family metal transporter [Clostridia bacterium]
MEGTIAAVILLPFFGTALGACAALGVKEKLPQALNRACSGFAAGVMTAASVWSLLIPALEQTKPHGPFSVFAVIGGYFAGVIGMTATEKTAARLLRKRRGGTLSGTAMMILAVTLHNVPEGLAVGVACAGLANHTDTVAGVTALSLGIALQNVPEGAVISLPLRAGGKSRARSCGYGVLSGTVEPASAVIALLAAAPIGRMMPFLLSCAAGAMLHVTVQELIPEAVTPASRRGAISFAAGFALMMAMDVLL